MLFHSTINMKRFFFFKSTNPTLFPHSSHNRHLRVADILLADEDNDTVDFMDTVHQTPSHDSHPPEKCSLGWLIRLFAALKPNKKRRILKRREKIPSTPIIGELKGSEEESRQLDWNDRSFKLGVGCGLLYVIAATKNELSKMVELRKEMETILRNMKGELEIKDVVVKSLKQCDDVLACSITDIREVSCSNGHPSVHSLKPYAQPELKRNVVVSNRFVDYNINVQQELKSNVVVSNRFVDYNISEQDECAEEINELQVEFEYELQRLQLYLDGEDAFEDAQQERVEVAANDSNAKSESESFGEIIMEPQQPSYDMSYGVSPVELERRLHELLEARLEERIMELESALEYATQKLNEKEIRINWWEDTARHVPHHVPETSRFTFPLDPESALKFSQVAGSLLKV